MLKILLNAGRSLEFVYGLLIFIIGVKITKTGGKSAGVYWFFLSKLLKEKIQKRSIHTSIASQRLHAGDLKWPKAKNNRIFYATFTVFFFSKKIAQASQSFKLNPYYITGFSDPHISLRSIYGGSKTGEACFHISILKDKKYKTGYRVVAIFTIQLHSKDIILLEKIKSYFDVGVIRMKNNNNAILYSVQSYKEIMEVIIPPTLPHFTYILY